ncbi:MAG: hypothetical protein FWH20_08340 [Oscillospiraceae bacterium]|nr:hypothetical protein [Oscillospiraceae bacterium]
MADTQNLLAEIPLKKQGQTARFFDERVEFGGQIVNYADIVTLRANADYTVNTYVGIPVWSDFRSGIHFKLNSGQTAKIPLCSMRVFGIPFGGSPGKTSKLFPPLLNAAYEIVAKNMAAQYINTIKSGGEVEICGLLINSTEASKYSKKKGKVPVINKENYRESQVTNNCGVAVYDKPGAVLWSSSAWKTDNALLIPHILDAVFG